MKKISIIQLLQKIHSGTQPKTIKVFDKYYDWNGEDYFNKSVGEYMIDTYVDNYFLKDIVNEYFIEIQEPASLTNAEKKWMEAIIELLGLSRDVTISKKDFPPFTNAKNVGLNQDTNLVKITIKCANGTCRAAVFDNSHFTGMEFNRDYTPDDLGLFNEEDK